MLFNWGNKPLACEIHDSDSGAHCTGPTNPSEPRVSLIITAYNEEERIKEKIKNTINQDYPKEKLEIIIASDCSSDKTDEIVKSFKDKDVKLVRAPERKGKENAQKHAIDASNGEILVFSDVATILKPDAISNIVKKRKPIDWFVIAKVCLNNKLVCMYAT
ncbi:glycosyltransferase [bacterium]|nr:glycosyltransferase [bacterium]